MLSLKKGGEMKKLSLDLSLEGIVVSQDDKDKTVSQICVQVMMSLLNAFSGQKQGLDIKERRVYYKLSDRLEEAAKSNLKEVEIDDEWHAFLIKAIETLKYSPTLISRRVEDLIEKAK